MNIKIYPIILLLVFLPLIPGCSEPTQPETHSTTWVDPLAYDFHGDVLALRGWDRSGSCQTCHGIEFDGGSSNVSCYQCHAGGPSGHPASSVFVWSPTPDQEPDFHGAGFSESSFNEDVDACLVCHGLTTGGAVDKSCSQCHPNGNPYN